MGEHQRPKLLGPNGRPAQPKDLVVDAAVLSPLQALQLDITDLQDRIAQMTDVINTHHLALVEITAALQTAERRSFRGRWRRLMIWLRLWVPTTPDPAARRIRRPARIATIPEAMPKA
jgi:hypothetical protein